MIMAATCEIERLATAMSMPREDRSMKGRLENQPSRRP